MWKSLMSVSVCNMVAGYQAVMCLHYGLNHCWRTLSFFSSACIICLMIDNKIFKGEAWSISLFLVFLVPFYNCMFEILFFLLGILSWMFNIIWVFIFAVICDLICWMLLTNLLFIVVLILLCMCISEFCVPISQLLSVSEMTYDNWIIWFQKTMFSYVFH